MSKMRMALGRTAREGVRGVIQGCPADPQGMQTAVRDVPQRVEEEQRHPGLEGEQKLGGCRVAPVGRPMMQGPLDSFGGTPREAGDREGTLLG